MATQVSIVNRALRRVGASRINSFDDALEEAQLARDIWSDTVAALLGGHPWTFCVVCATTPLAATTRQPGFQYAFALPATCTRVLAIVADGVDTDDDGAPFFGDVGTTSAARPFEIRGRVLVTDVEEPIIQYLAANTDVSTWPPTFVEAVVAALAVEFSYALSTNAGLAAQLRRDAAVARQSAMAEDCQRNKRTLERLGRGILDARRKDSP